MNVVRTSEGWSITTAQELSNDEARAITFRADPKQVVLGDFVEVVDAGGTRIGHLSSATYHENLYMGPSYVICSIHLR